LTPIRTATIKTTKKNGENGENEICSYEENSQKIETIFENYSKSPMVNK